VSELSNSRESTAALSRRRFFGFAGAGTAGVLAAGAAGGAIGRATAADAPSTGPAATDAVPFAGAHQAGILTPAQDRLHFVAFDVITDSRDELVAMLKAWTEAARRMTAGKDAGPVGAVDGGQYAPPDDTGEALGLPASGLTPHRRVRPDPVHRRRRHRPLRPRRAPSCPPGRATELPR
jgi:deferrochelatase/peroxidase EfeB